MSKANSPQVTISGSHASQASKNPRQTALHIGFLIVLSLLTMLPVLIRGAPKLSDDAIDHARSTVQFATQLWQGDWYPRWFPSANGGLGGPAGFFYPPLARYAAAAFWPFTAARDPEGWLAAGYAAALAQVLSGIAAYLWLLSLVKSRAALFGAVVYCLAPYHLPMDVYRRFALAEVWLFVWFPLVMLAAEGIIRRSKWGVPGAAVAYALAVLSHPTVSVCFAPIPVAYVLFFSERKDRIRNTILLSAALLLGVGLSATYLLPAMLDREKTRAQLYIIGHGDYHNEWIFLDFHNLVDMLRWLLSVPGTTLSEHNPYFHFRARMLGVTLLTAAGVAVMSVTGLRSEKGQRQRGMIAFWTIVAAITLFLMTSYSSLVWEAAGFMRFLQFPFRFNVLLTLSLAAIAALAGQYLRNERMPIITWSFLAVLAFCLAIDVSYATAMFHENADSPEFQHRREFMLRQIDTPEMLPNPGNARAMSGIPSFDLFVLAHPPQHAKLEAMSRQLSGTARVVNWKPRRIILNIDAPSDSTLVLNQFYCAGWRARKDGVAADLPVRASADGLMEMEVPAGSYQLTVELPKDTAERAGIVISSLSLALVGGIAVWNLLRSARPAPGRPAPAS